MFNPSAVYSCTCTLQKQRCNNRIIKSFTWGSAYINYQALVNLVQKTGAIVRTGSILHEGISSHFEHIMKLITGVIL